MYFITVLEVESLKSRCQQGCAHVKPVEGASFLAFSYVLVVVSDPWFTVSSLQSLLFLWHSPCVCVCVCVGGWVAVSNFPSYKDTRMELGLSSVLMISS